MIHDELQELIGAALLRRFLAVFAATRVAFEKRPGGASFDRVARVVGQDAAERLRQRFAGLRLYIPTDAERERARRNEQILARLAAGEGSGALARYYRVSHRQIERIAARERRAQRTSHEPVPSNRRALEPAE